MKFMNRWDIDRAVGMYGGASPISARRHPVLGPAAETVRNLADWADQNSDGWAYWPKPCRAAKRLIELIERDGTNQYFGGPREDATVEEYKAALRPIKAFRTRQDADFEIVEVS